jgi:hypothetical protein
MKDVRSGTAAHRPPERAVQGSEQSRPTELLRPSDAAKCSPTLRPSAARITLADQSLRRGAACCARCSTANQRHSLARDRSPWSLRHPASTATPRAENFADHSLRRGTACCARRSAADQRHPLADAAFGSRQGTASAVPNCVKTSGVSTPEVRATNIPTIYQTGTTNLLAPMQAGLLSTDHCPCISTRFCPKNRSHTKHTTKPSLPGSRFACCRPRTSFAKPLSNRELHLLEPTLTHRKQTIAPRSNRELSTNPVTLTLASTWHRMTGNQ